MSKLNEPSKRAEYSSLVRLDIETPRALEEGRILPPHSTRDIRAPRALEEGGRK